MFAQQRADRDEMEDVLAIRPDHGAHGRRRRQFRPPAAEPLQIDVLVAGARVDPAQRKLVRIAAHRHGQQHGRLADRAILRGIGRIGDVEQDVAVRPLRRHAPDVGGALLQPAIDLVRRDGAMAHRAAGRDLRADGRQRAVAEHRGKQAASHESPSRPAAPHDVAAHLRARFERGSSTAGSPRPRAIAARMRLTTVASPSNTASPTRKWPILSSTICGTAASVCAVA